MFAVKDSIDNGRWTLDGGGLYVVYVGFDFF